jgi:hypothetical protein
LHPPQASKPILPGNVKATTKSVDLCGDCSEKRTRAAVPIIKELLRNRINTTQIALKRAFGVYKVADFAELG